MIYVDVTSACLLPLQSGIPRTTRGIFRLLEQYAPSVKPILWQPFFHEYCELSPRAKRMLINPFTEKSGSDWTKRDWLLPLLWASAKEANSGSARLSLNRLTQKEDTLLVTSLFPDNRLLYLKKLLKTTGRKIVIFHDAIPLSDPNLPEIGKPFHRYLLTILAGFDLVICVSKAAELDLMRLWKDYSITPAPTRVIPWPVPFTITQPAFKKPDYEKKKVLYVSRLKKIKNHASLLKASEVLWKENIDFELELIGCEDVPSESRSVIETVETLRRKGFPVSWRGQVSEEELHAAYQTCSFTVFPSLMEGFGLPIVESLWHGRPVLCGSSGAMGEVALGPGTIRVDLEDPTSLLRVMRELLTNTARGQALAWEAHQRPVRTWEEYWRDLEPLL